MASGITTRAHAERYREYLWWALGIVAGMVLLGFAPTRRLGGEAALPAMWAGCAVSLVGSLAGSWSMSRQRGFDNIVARVMGTLAIRLALILVLGLALALGGWLQPVPLLLWIAISHAGLLVADTRYALGIVESAKELNRTDETTES